MRRNCILSLLMLVILMTACQRGEEAVQAPTQTAEDTVDAVEDSQDTVIPSNGQSSVEEPRSSADSNAAGLTRSPAAEAATPSASPAALEPPKTQDPVEPPREETVAEKAVEPPPRPPRMADIEESEFGPDPEVAFAEDAFPPTLSDTEWHANAWNVNDCLRCHETGVGTAPPVVHDGLGDVLLRAKCRSCHVLIPGQSANAVVVNVEEADAQLFDEDAFPPMIPNSRAHINTWTSEDCMYCHEDGLKGAPIAKHESQHMPRLLLKVKCRTCHVQVRAIESALATQ